MTGPWPPRVAGTAGAAVGGTALGAAAAMGGALLLFTDEGFLPTFGFLLALVAISVAAGIWAHRPGPAGALPTAGGRPPRGWAAVVVAFGLAGAFAVLWLEVVAVREALLGRAFGVVLFLAEPAYASGSLLAALHTRGLPRRPAHVAAPALAGIGVGVLATTTLFIPHVYPAGIFFMGAVALMTAGWAERRAWARVGAVAPAGSEADHEAAPRRSLMRDRVIIVTGVGRRGQVGYAVAEALLEAGARLAITASSSAIVELAADLGRRGDVAGEAADLTRPQEADRIVRLAIERFGRLDGLVNVAGGLGVIKPIAETLPEEWELEWRRNAETAFHMCRAALPALRERGGAIVNFASPAGERAAANVGAYSAAKAGVIALTRTLALEELEHGIRVNAIAPGFIDTEQNRKSVDAPESVRWVTREEIAAAVAFLLGDGASGISGQTLRVLGRGLD